jgi:hypothetical protein
MESKYCAYSVINSTYLAICIGLHFICENVVSGASCQVLSFHADDIVELYDSFTTLLSGKRDLLARRYQTPLFCYAGFSCRFLEEHTITSLI